jgi:hypothetical protein
VWLGPASFEVSKDPFTAFSLNLTNLIDEPAKTIRHEVAMSSTARAISPGNQPPADLKVCQIRAKPAN